MCIFSFILLFGAIIRDYTSVSRKGLLICDVVFIITFAFFVIDIIMRMDAKPNYFRIRMPCCSGAIEFGSFLFWCDVISTVTLLHEISWIYPTRFMTQIMFVTIDKGFPVSGKR
jgi:hypothetical protein